MNVAVQIAPNGDFGFDNIEKDRRLLLTMLLFLKIPVESMEKHSKGCALILSIIAQAWYV